MLKKFIHSKRADRLLRFAVLFSVRMLSRYLDPWSRSGADVLVEYVNSMWDPGKPVPVSGLKPARKEKDVKKPPSDNSTWKEVPDEK